LVGILLNRDNVPWINGSHGDRPISIRSHVGDAELLQPALEHLVLGLALLIKLILPSLNMTHPRVIVLSLAITPLVVHASRGHDVADGIIFVIPLDSGLDISTLCDGSFVLVLGVW
jgi:hypothetical protein